MGHKYACKDILMANRDKFLQEPEKRYLLYLEHFASISVVDENVVTTIDNYSAIHEDSGKKVSMYDTAYAEETHSTDIQKRLSEKSEEILAKIKDLGDDVRITDFQLSVRESEVCLVEKDINTPQCYQNTECSLEVEVQRTVNGVTMLGSSYIYETSLDRIRISDIMESVSFPFIYDHYQTIDKSAKYDYIVFGPPIAASFFENVSYYSLMHKPVVVTDSKISLYDNPILQNSFNQCLFDDKGNKTKIHHLYGFDKGYEVSAISSQYLVSNKNFLRDVKCSYNTHASNIVIEGPMVERKEKMSQIKEGLYCHLIVGNHYSRGDYIEGTVFNSFIIEYGQFKHALAPFKIRVKKSELLESIECVGNDFKLIRPFPWWTPAVVYTPTIFTKGIQII